MAANAIPTPELQLTSEKNDDQVLVRGTGRINSASTDMLESTIRSLLPGAKRIVLDLTGVEYIDSSGLGALVSIYMAANRANCILEVANPRQRIRDLFKITKLAAIFEGTGENYFGGM